MTKFWRNYRLPFEVGDFIYAWIIPLDEEIFMFSGAVAGVPGKRRAVVESVQDLRMRNPVPGYQRNPAKIELPYVGWPLVFPIMPKRSFARSWEDRISTWGSRGRISGDFGDAILIS